MRGVVLGLVIALCATTAQAAGDDAAKVARAKVLYEEGLKQYNLGRFTEALASFQEAYLSKPDPVFLFNVGQCNRQLGHWKEASYAYGRYLGERPDAPNRAEVEKFIATAEEENRRKTAGAPPTNVMAPREGSPPPVAVEAKTTVAPLAVAPATPAPPPPAHDEPTPIYKKWWLWTAVGVVVAAGVGIGVAFAVPKDAPIPANAAATTMINF